VVEVVDLARLEIELVQSNGDVVGAETAVLPPGVQERFCVVRLQKIGDGLWWCGYLGCAHSVPPSGTAF